jgi:tRNA A-37 threonylcarbamoyl transferase component Bud32
MSGVGQGEVFSPLEADDPTSVGAYRLSARLGAGGMGKVYLSHTPAGRPVAVKVIRPEFAEDAEFRRRFKQEVQAAQRVQGLYTAPVIDSDADGLRPWLATAFVPGPTLASAVAGHGPLPVQTVLLLVAGIAEALEAVHAAGLVHRDLKPSNVLLASDGPRVIDFGIARAADTTALTASGVTIGTPAFMSPEQAAGREITPAPDVFALGQVAAYAVLGAPAYGDGPSHAVLYRIVHEEPDLARIPEELRGLVGRCLVKEPGERPSLAEVVGMCRAASQQTELRRPEQWLPSALAAEIPARHVAPASPAAPPVPAAPALLGRDLAHGPALHHQVRAGQQVRVGVDVERVGDLDGEALLLQVGQEEAGDLHRRMALPAAADHEGPAYRVSHGCCTLPSVSHGRPRRPRTGGSGTETSRVRGMFLAGCPLPRAAPPGSLGGDRQHVRGQGGRARRGAGHPAPVGAPAEHLVADLRRGRDVPDDHLRALHHHHPADGAGVVGGAGTAPAQRLDLEGLHPVGEFDEPLRGREEPGAEVGGDAEGVDVQVEFVHRAGQLVDLLRREELRLVHHREVHPAAAAYQPHQVGVQVHPVADLHRVGDQAEPGGQLALAGPVVLGEDHRLEAAGGAVVHDLQGERALAAVHRAGEEDQF